MHAQLIRRPRAMVKAGYAALSGGEGAGEWVGDSKGEGDGEGKRDGRQEREGCELRVRTTSSRLARWMRRMVRKVG